MSGKTSPPLFASTASPPQAGCECHGSPLRVVESTVATVCFSLSGFNSAMCEAQECMQVNDGKKKEACLLCEAAPAHPQDHGMQARLRRFAQAAAPWLLAHGVRIELPHERSAVPLPALDAARGAAPWMPLREARAAPAATMPLDAVPAAARAAAHAGACSPGAAAAEAYRDTRSAARVQADPAASPVRTAGATAPDAPLRSEPMMGCMTTLEAIVRCAPQLPL